MRNIMFEMHDEPTGAVDPVAPDLNEPVIPMPADGYGVDKTDTDLSDLYRDSDSDSDCDCDCDVENESDPSDETAATCDDDCGCNDCECTSAKEKCKLDDYEIISDVLGGEKQLVKLYSTALCESAEEPLRNIIRDNLSECAADQFAAFEYMQKRGLYQTEEADVIAIEQARQQFGDLV